MLKFKVSRQKNEIGYDEKLILLKPKYAQKVSMAYFCFCYQLTHVFSNVPLKRRLNTKAAFFSNHKTGFQGKVLTTSGSLYS